MTGKWFDPEFPDLDWDAAQARVRKYLKDLMNVEAVARFLGVSRATVFRWVKAGKLRSYSPSPRELLFRRSDVSKLLLEEARRRGLEIKVLGVDDCMCEIPDDCVECPICDSGGRCSAK